MSYTEFPEGSDLYVCRTLGESVIVCTDKNQKLLHGGYHSDFLSQADSLSDVVRLLKNRTPEAFQGITGKKYEVEVIFCKPLAKPMTKSRKGGKSTSTKSKTGRRRG